MGFDYNSLLMASGAAGVALCFTLMSSWLRERGSIFLLTWAACIAIIIAAIVAFSVFHNTVNVLHSMLAGVLLTSAFAISYGGFTQFSTGRFETARVALLGVVSAAPIIVSGALGFDGLSFVFINLMSALLLGFCGYQYWTVRAESPGPITAIAALHWMLTASYVFCVVAVALETPLYLNGRVPDNWAEALNLMVSVIALTGIGGLFVTVHQERISRRHRDASLIDPLTGLSNRRALFERFSEGHVPQGTGLVVLDLDDFKGLNDRHGHAFGDTVLRSFARLLVENCRGEDMAVRLGGEEFVLVLPGSSTTQALALAERVRSAMGRMIHTADAQPVTCTVSAGVAVAERPGLSLDSLIRKADNALYLSKRSGRNRVSQTTSTAA
ncbi:GGDEF domain-containing protein [Pelagibacterium halotolerans]|uniref:diguanylate cyclase n=1 Tax=Pelagibacterium halotolerans (strain DSM 22347 / JCM 15775 / CGMCC 1.7692 / B2) TaxID=1082931 RepID=G4R7H7_PELHB|nr:GGDEF domain-containing protein [Pelagibacterium halotolerans]AEQ52278.1 diguanylate cyclase (GGDEF domain) [Pelagibacterium halotolerans B2]QJR17973.1 GGDEF domain-containing protein [Pelagibacterium halotolerans]SEA31918.1 diguanylate cyclase (GGDEF) domain-containing protein [Pelagibacterium halotolerans]